MDEKNADKKFFEELRLIRTNNDIDLHEISEKTKINIKYLEFIEKGNFDALPNIYVRLFIRSYAQFLGADPKLILLEYDKHTDISPRSIFSKKTKKQTLKPNISKLEILSKDDIPNKDNLIETTNKEKNIIKSKEYFQKKSNIIKENKKNLFADQQYFFSPANIFKIITSSFFILGVYLIVSFLSSEQEKNINSIDDIPHAQSEIINSTTNQLIMDNALLSSEDFQSEKLINKKSFKLKHKIEIPYTFQIISKEKTKLYVSHENNDGKRIEDCNKIVSKDSLLKFENTSNIYFDLWNAQHVEISINNKPISKYLGKDDVLIRGSFEPENKNLYLEFFSH